MNIICNGQILYERSTKKKDIFLTYGVVIQEKLNNYCYMMKTPCFTECKHNLKYGKSSRGDMSFAEDCQHCRRVLHFASKAKVFWRMKLIRCALQSQKFELYTDGSTVSQRCKLRSCKQSYCIERKFKSAKKSGEKQGSREQAECVSIRLRKNGTERETRLGSKANTRHTSQRAYICNIHI